MTAKFEPILPDPFKSKAFQVTVEAAMRLTNTLAEVDFKKTTATWKKKPGFVKEYQFGKGRKTASVTTDNEIYKYVDEGTPPHEIRAKPGGTLAFGTPSSPKTQPGVIGSTGGSVGGNAVFTQVVHHPGTKAREFSITIKKKFVPIYGKSLQKAYYLGADKSGHGI